MQRQLEHCLRVSYLANFNSPDHRTLSFPTQKLWNTKETCILIYISGFTVSFAFNRIASCKLAKKSKAYPHSKLYSKFKHSGSNRSIVSSFEIPRELEYCCTGSCMTNFGSDLRDASINADKSHMHGTYRASSLYCSWLQGIRERSMQLYKRFYLKHRSSCCLFGLFAAADAALAQDKVTLAKIHTHTHTLIITHRLTKSRMTLS